MSRRDLYTYEQIAKALKNLENRICCSTNLTGILSIVEGDNINVDNTDPQNPIISSTSGSGDNIYTVDGVLAGIRVVGLDSNSLSFEDHGTALFLLDPLNQAARLRADADGDTYSSLELQGQIGGGISFTLGSFDNSDGSFVTIIGDGASSTITHSADTHTFNVGTGGVYSVNNGSADLLSMQGGGNGSMLSSHNNTGNGNNSQVALGTSDTDATATLKADFNDGVKESQIEVFADATSSTITYTGDEHLIKTASYAPGLLQIQDAGGIVNIGDHDAQVNGTSIKIQDVNQIIIYTSEIHSFAGKVNMNKILNLAVFANSSPTDGDIWRADNTNTGLKIRINGVTKTITVT